MLNVICIDDNEVILEGLAILLPTILDIEIVGQAYNGNQAVALVQSLEPDLVIMDLMMSDGGGIKATKLIKENNPDIKILGFSMMNDILYIDAMLKAGANGYTIKNTSGEELKEAIHTIMKGEKYIHPSLTKSYFKSIEIAEINKSYFLSVLDIKIIDSFSKGLTTEEIAKRVFESEDVIEQRKKSLLKRFDCSTSEELVAFAIRYQFIS